MSEFEISEKEAAEQIGVPQEKLKEIRDGLERGKDWNIVRGAILLTKTAVATVLGKLGLKDVADLPEKKDPPPATTPEPVPPASVQMAMQRPGTEAILVMARKWRNSRIVGAHRQGSTEILRVRVKDNENFVLGMEIPARHVAQDLWELVGKCPRRRGKW